MHEKIFDNGNTSVITAYDLSHLAEHIFTLKKVYLLYQLVTSEAWLSRSTHFDRSKQQYFSDLDWSYRALVAQIAIGLEHDESQKLEQTLPSLTTLTWLSAYLRQSAGIMNPNILEAMTRIGQGDQALRRAYLIPDPIRQATALIWIGFGAFETNCHQIADEAWKSAQRILNCSPLDFLMSYMIQKLY